MTWLADSKKKAAKIIAVAVAGTFILAGVAFASNGGPGKHEPGQGHNKGAYEQRQIDPDKANAKIADAFGVSKDTVAKYQSQGYDYRDLWMAGVMSKASGQSYDSVIAMKTKDNTWKDVMGTLNVTPEQIKAVHQGIMAKHISQGLKMDQGTIQGLLQNGYKPFDIVPAGVLANRTGKSIQSVLDMKKINNTWHDVCGSLGVAPADFRADLQSAAKDCGFGAMHKGFHGHGGQGPQGHQGQGMRHQKPNT